MTRLLSTTAILLCITTSALSRELYPGRYAQVDPRIKEWVEQLTDKEGHGCCATADGFPLQDLEWGTGANGYRVKIDGEWYDVPDVAVVPDRNLLGAAHIWYYHANGSVKIRCFLPGSQG